MRLHRLVALGAAALVALVPSLGAGTAVAGAARGAAATTTGSRSAVVGPVQLWMYLARPTGALSVVVTGAIGDHGTAESSTATGRRLGNHQSDFLELRLTRGSIVLDAALLNRNFQGERPAFDASTCSATLRASGRVRIVHGSGAYAKVRGSIALIAQGGGVWKLGADRRCQPGGEPAASFEMLTGSGTLTP